MASSSTPTKTAAKGTGKAPAKKPAKKAAGSNRVAALASKLATSPGSVKATASLPVTSPDAAAATAALLGLPVAAAPSTPVVPTSAPPTEQTSAVPSETTSETASEVTSGASEPVSDRAVSPATGPQGSANSEDAAAVAEQERTQDAEAGGEAEREAQAVMAERAPQPLSLVPDPASTEDETTDHAVAQVEGATENLSGIPAGIPAETPAEVPASSAQPGPKRPVPSTDVTKRARRSAAKKHAASKAPALVAPVEGETEQAERLDELVWTLSSPEHSLDQQHDRISKLTLELPIPLVDVLNRWELDQVRRTGRRLYRERLIDLALAELPADMDKVVAMARDLPAWLKYAETEQVGSRVRAPVALELKVMKQELKLRREKGTYVRHIYAVALLDFLTSYGVPVEEPTR